MMGLGDESICALDKRGMDGCIFREMFIASLGDIGSFAFFLAGHVILSVGVYV